MRIGFAISANPTHKERKEGELKSSGESRGARTLDPKIKSLVLCQLSYTLIEWGRLVAPSELVPISVIFFFSFLLVISYFNQKANTADYCDY